MLFYFFQQKSIHDFGLGPDGGAWRAWREAVGSSTPCRFANEETVYFEMTVSGSQSFTIPAGSSRNLVLVADTSNMLTGKVNGNVSVAVSVPGEVGLKLGNNGYEKNWADTGLIYSYTPIMSSKVGPFSAVGASFGKFVSTYSL